MNKKQIPELFCVEIKEAGIWNDYFYTEFFLEACYKASSFADYTQEEYIRIVTPDNKIL